MRRVRWALVLLAGVAVVGVGAAVVLARSTATYANHAIPASTFTSNGSTVVRPGQLGVWNWLGDGKTATWTFNVSGLQTAISDSVALNFSALSTNRYWGAGFSNIIKVNVIGTGQGTFTTTLVNPWRPHIAYNDTAGIGWQAYASLNVPKYVWSGASSLTVTVTPITTYSYTGVNPAAVLIGYATTP